MTAARTIALASLAALLFAASVAAHEIKAAKPGKAKPAFEIVAAEVKVDGSVLVFRMDVKGRAGTDKPARTGKTAGAGVHAYVWPTSLDSAAAGFEAGQGILALAVTAHPDFDDTPLFDENADGRTDNDGGLWHAHWVVLGADEACGKGALKVKDIAKDAKPRLPKTWPSLPILLDSPGYSPVVSASRVLVRVPLEDIGIAKGAKFDAVTAGLKVNANLHAPLLCVTNVFAVASGDLSLPGVVE